MCCWTLCAPQDSMMYHIIWDICIKLVLFLYTLKIMKSCDEYNMWFTSGPLHSRPRYHDTASQRTLASFKMQTDTFSACMPACFHLLLMNHLARTHCFMYTRRFYSNLKSPEHVFFTGAIPFVPDGLKTQTYRKGNWSAVSLSLGLSSAHIYAIVSGLDNSSGIICALAAICVMIRSFLNIWTLFVHIVAA